jgi:hypothetical protein
MAYQANKEKIIANQMEYYRQHRDKYIAYMREYNKAYYQANRNRIAAKQQGEREAKRDAKAMRPYIRKQCAKDKGEVCNIVYIDPPCLRSRMFVDKGNFTLEFR